MAGIFGNGRYANVTATMALVVALGGSAYAANTVRSTDIKNGEVKRVDLANNAVTSGKVKNGALLSRDFKAGQIPAGQKGATGATGATGPKGDKGDKGDAGAVPRVKVSCKLVNKRRSVSCKVKPVGGESRRLTATVRAAGKKAKATRRGRTIKLTLNAQRRLTRSTTIRVNVRSGNASTLFAVGAR